MSDQNVTLPKEEMTPAPRDIETLRALPVLDGGKLGRLDLADDAIYAFKDADGTWQPVYHNGKWHKQRWGV